MTKSNLSQFNSWKKNPQLHVVRRTVKSVLHATGSNVVTSDCGAIGGSNEGSCSGECSPTK